MYLILKQMVQVLIPCVGSQNTSGYKSFGKKLKNKPTLHKELKILRFPMFSGSQVQFVLSLEVKVYRATLTWSLRLTCYSAQVLCYGGSFNLFLPANLSKKVKITHHFWQGQVAAGFRYKLLFVAKWKRISSVCLTTWECPCLICFWIPYFQFEFVKHGTALQNKSICFFPGAATYAYM